MACFLWFWSKVHEFFSCFVSLGRKKRKSDIFANFCSAAHTEKEISEKLSLGMQKSLSNYRKLLCTWDASKKFFFLILEYKYKYSDECTCDDPRKSISIGPATQVLYFYLLNLYLSDLWGESADFSPKHPSKVFKDQNSSKPKKIVPVTKLPLGHCLSILLLFRKTVN